jgi:hypothetical protein
MAIGVYRDAALLLLISMACAQTSGRNAVIWEPPLLFTATDDVPKGTIPKDIVTKLRVSDKAIVLEETKVADIQAQFKTSIGNRGDAANFLEWVCFYGDNNNWVLWLTSDEIDGGTVGGFQWQLLPAKARIDRRCRQLGDSAVTLPNGIRLGMPERELLRIMGQPAKRDGQRLMYVHEEEQVIRDEPYTETNVVVVKIHNMVVSAIAVSKSTVS